MLEDRHQRGRVIGAVVLVLLALLALLSPSLQGEVVAWLWIAGLIVAAALLAWAYLITRTHWVEYASYASFAGALVVMVVARVEVSLSLVLIATLLVLLGFGTLRLPTQPS